MYVSMTITSLIWSSSSCYLLCRFCEHIRTIPNSCPHQNPCHRTHTHTHMYVCMYVCMYVSMTITSLTWSSSLSYLSCGFRNHIRTIPNSCAHQNPCHSTHKYAYTYAYTCAYAIRNTLYYAQYEYKGK